MASWIEKPTERERFELQAYLAPINRDTAHQDRLQGVNFGRRSPSSGGQNCTPNNTRLNRCQSTRPRAEARRASLAALPHVFIDGNYRIRRVVADFSRNLETQPLPDPGVGLFRVAPPRGHAEKGAAAALTTSPRGMFRRS